MFSLLFLACLPSKQDTSDMSAYSESVSGTFSVLTYNIHGLPPQITGDDTTERIEKITPLLNGYDFVGLQEDFMDENHLIIEEGTEHSSIHRFDDIQEDRFYGSGLSFLGYREQEISSDYQEIHFDSCYGYVDHASDCLSSKGFQKIRFQLARDCFVDFYNTHLEAGNSEEDHEVRVQQVNMIISSVKNTPTNTIVVFLGDTNIQPSDPMETDLWNQFLEDGMFLDSCEVTSCPETNHIDRIWYWSSNQIENCRLEAKQWNNESAFFDEQGIPLSDHPALSVFFEWSRF